MPYAGLVFLLVFVGAPLVELYLLIEVGSEIGALPTQPGVEPLARGGT